MRSIPAEFQARLDGGATTMCRCWLLTRRDGVKLGFTDHDEDLTFEGVVFQAGAGMDASSVEATTGLSVDNGQVSGALRADCLSEADIAAGRFDGAEVRQWLADWSRPDLRVLVFRGSIGEIRRGKLAFEAELRGLAEGLNKPVGRAYLRRCDARLGDARCGLDLSGSVETLAAGCDGSRDTCANKFNNFINFRGFPHLPGEDWVVSYPQEGDRLDGGSLYRD